MELAVVAEVVAWVVAAALAVPLTVLAVECLLALKRWRPVPPPDPATRPRFAVLIPAHNEEGGLGRTLTAVLSQVGPGDRVLVVADNCTDATAAVARARGAEVVERTDAARRGKAYALAFGRDALAADPPEVVIVVDADCTLGEHTLDRLAAGAAGGRAVQAANRLSAPAGSGPDRQVAAFAFVVKNVVRPLGLSRLGRPCLLTGTGMAFPWAVFAAAPLGHGHIVEDLGLSVDLALAGRPPVFAPDAEVRGEFPVDEGAAGSQRKRWVHGHLRVLVSGVPRLLRAAVARGRPGLLLMALDIGVPPLSALVVVAGGAFAALLLWAALGGPWGPAALLAWAGAVAAVGLAGAWWRYGREVLPSRTLLRIPRYAVGKLPLYFGFVFKPQRDWVRTPRDEPPKA